MRRENLSQTVVLSFCALMALAPLACGGKTSETGDVLDGSVAIDSGTGSPDTHGAVDGAPVDTGGVTTDTSLDAGEDFTSCTGPGTCVAAPRTCCGVCGAASPTDIVGLERTRASSYRTAVCSGSGCPACFRPVDPFLQAYCVVGQCQAVDLHTRAETTCATDDDCQLRYAGCCEACGAPTDGLFALRKDAVDAYRKAVCEADSACPKCAIAYPSGTRATCDDTKHCAVTSLTVGD